MREFIEKGYPTGISGTTLRISRGTRSLAVYDRTAVPAALGIADFVLPDATAVLLHDHSDTDLTRNAAAALLDDLAAAAAALETAGRTPSALQTVQKE